MGDFGAQLRAARERKGISLRQIAASTKISVAALESLERNDISKLPGGIFSRAFVRSYAIEVGLDPDETVRQFLERFASEPPVASSASSPFGPAHSRSARTPIGETADARSPTLEADFESKQQMARIVLRLALVSLPIAAGIIYFGARGSSVAPASSGAIRPEATDSSPADVASSEPLAPRPPLEAAAPAVSRVEPQTGSAPGASAATSGSAALRLEIAPTAACWVNLTIDGDVAVSRVIPAGERESREFRDTAVLQVGDAAACAVSIDGHPVRPLGRPRQVRELRLTRDNYRAFLRE